MSDGKGEVPVASANGGWRADGRPEPAGRRLSSRRRGALLRRIGRAGLSAILPGLGQVWYRPGRALVMLGLAGALVLGTLLLLMRPAAELVGYVLRAEVLVGALVMNVVLLAVRAWAVIDAFTVGAGASGRRGKRGPARAAGGYPRVRRGARRLLVATAGVAAGLCVLGLLLVPHALAARYTSASYRVVTGVFAPEEGASHGGAEQGSVGARWDSRLGAFERIDVELPEHRRRAPFDPHPASWSSIIDPAELAGRPPHWQAVSSWWGRRLAEYYRRANEPPHRQAVPARIARQLRLGYAGGFSPALLDYDPDEEPWVPDPPEEPYPPASISEEPWEERGRINVLLLGSDEGPGRTGARMNAVMVASFDLDTGDIVLFGIPRNTFYAPLSGEVAEKLGEEMYPDMLFKLYPYAQDYPELGEDGEPPGMVATRNAVENLLGIPVDYCFLANMEGFVCAIDALGGVTINVPDPIHVRLSPHVEGDEPRVYELDEGRQELDGNQAMAFVRTRTNATDYDRMRRQRCIVGALLDQLSPGRIIRAYPELAEVVADHAATDLPIEAFLELLGAGTFDGLLDVERILAVGLTQPVYALENVPHVELIRETVAEALAEPEAFRGKSPEESGVYSLEESACW